MNLGTEVIMRASALSDGTSITEYSDSSDYVSSVEGNTPFPSLTLSKKFELERYIHNGIVVSTFSNDSPEARRTMSRDSLGIVLSSERSANIEEPKIVKEESVKDIEQQNSIKQESENISCCLLL